MSFGALAAATTHGLPVIGTEVVDKPDEALEHGRNVYLCPPRDAAALADAMRQLIEDGVFRERLRRGSRSLAAAWHDWPAMTERLAAVLADALPSARAPQSRTGGSGADMRLVEARPERAAFYPTDPPVRRLRASEASRRHDARPGHCHRACSRRASCNRWKACMALSASAVCPCRR